MSRLHGPTYLERTRTFFIHPGQLEHGHVTPAGPNECGCRGLALERSYTDRRFKSLRSDRTVHPGLVAGRQQGVTSE